MKTYKESIECDALYESMERCKRGKTKKASVARYVLHGVEETLKLNAELKSGKYLPRAPRTFTLTYPKVRPCSSIHIRDRIVQRSLNDNLVYPSMTRSFIWDNMACQKGKGTTRAMDRIDHLLHRYFINYGVNGHVFQFDIKGYYKSMRHKDARKCLLRRLSVEAVDNLEKWLQRQYPYDVGYEPGSQTVQILGIAVPDGLDHKIKNIAKNYIRYMDDGVIISNSYELLELCKELIAEELAKLGMVLHEKKSKIYPLSKGIKILGFTFHLTDTGKVIRIIDPKNVKHERKKLLRMAHLVAKREMTVRQFYDGYDSWKAHAELGNSSMLLGEMDRYVRTLMEDIRNDNNSERREANRESAA